MKKKSNNEKRDLESINIHKSYPKKEKEKKSDLTDVSKMMTEKAIKAGRNHARPRVKGT